MKVIIETARFQPFELDSQKSIDWNNSSDRKWLVNHLHWAMHNERQVTICPDGLVEAHESYLDDLIAAN